MNSVKSSKSPHSLKKTNPLEFKIQEITVQLASLCELLRKEQDEIKHVRFRPIFDLSQVLEETRKAQKVSQKVLADLANVAIGTVQSIENGKTTVTVENLVKVLNVLGKSLWVK